MGWRTRRKIVVFESDDWGSLRMPAADIYEKLERAGLDLRSADAERYNRNDNLATSKDIESLFEELVRIKDKNGNSAVFTPVSIVANPDFKKIEDSGYEKYFYEPFTETLKRFKGCEGSFRLWKEGIEKRLFVPQMHGREHLNVKVWMNALNQKDKDVLFAFKHGVWGFVPKSYPKMDYQAAFLLNDISDLQYHEKVIKEGLDIFENIFGYRAVYFVPPNGQFNNSLNKVLIDSRIKLRSAALVQVESLAYGKTKKRIHFLGQKDKHGMQYITRNCVFEPGQKGRDWVDSCLNDIRSAFKWNKPAIISTHRVNYVGALNISNRDNGLKQLSLLLEQIVKNWPDVEFMTTEELGDLMRKA